jgi:hypothetical protein
MFDRRPEMPLSQGQRAVLRSDFHKLYETYYPLFGNESDTTEFVVGQMSNSWGKDEITGTRRLMYLGPTSPLAGYAPLAGSWDWMRDDLYSGMGWDENVEFDLVADPQTQGEIAAGQRASDLVLTRDDYGNLRTEMDEQGVPKRIRFSQSPEIIERHNERVLERNLEERLRRLNEEVDTRHMDPTMHKLGDRTAIEATEAQLEELRSRRGAREAAERAADPIGSFEQNFNVFGDQ